MIKKASLLFMIASMLVLGGCGKKLHPSEAIQLAEEALAEYCLLENLTRSNFGKSDISPEKKYDWSISYESNSTPKHNVIFYINDGTVVERHRLIEEE